MSTGLITFDVEGKVALIGLNRADKRNAISEAVITELRDAVLRAGDEADAGVLFGHGLNFSAGLDLAELAARIAPEANLRASGGLTLGTPRSI
jgi:enoyl-CoA hydratase/carnithine racemase